MSKKISLLLAASVFLSGTTGAFLGAMTPGYAITSVDELSDVDQNHWAYEALRDLVEKYDVIEGYPDSTFRGNRTPTRWEMAAALNSLIRAVGRDLARLGAEKADKADLQTLARLQEQFRNELAALQARTSALEARAAAIEAKNTEQDNRLSLLEKTQIHGDMTFGGLWDISEDGVGGGDGIREAISALGRLRLTLDVPVKEESEDSFLGRGDVHTRLIAAFGRFAPGGGEGGTTGLLNPINGYSRIATDRSAFNEGISAGTIVGGGNIRSNLYVENMHYKQHINPGVPLLSDWFPGMDVVPDEDEWETTGDLYVGVVPWRYLFDRSPYRGDELHQFQNVALVNTPGVPTNYNMPMIAYQWHQLLGSDDLSLDLTAAVGTIDTGSWGSAWNLSYEGRLNYGSVLGEDWDMPGSLYAGGFHMWDTGAFSPANTLRAGRNHVGGGPGLAMTQDDSQEGFYAGWNQGWFEEVGTTVNYMLASNGESNLLYTTANQSALGGPLTQLTPAGTGLVGYSVRQAISGVLSVPMGSVLPGWRDEDAFGVGFATLDVYRNGFEDSDTVDKAWEKVLEAYYRWQVNDSVSVVPSVQFIWDRAGVEQNDFTTVLGLRTNFTF